MNLPIPDPPKHDMNWRGRLWRAARLMTGLELSTVDAIANELTPVALPGGAILFDAGEPGDTLYFVYRGCLGVFARDAAGQVKLSGEVAAGETVGELSLIAGRKRSATVAALRDSELGMLTREAFDRLARQHPHAMAHLLQFIVRRLDRIIRNEGVQHPPRTFALLPVDANVPLADFAREFSAALDRLAPGTPQILTGETELQTTEWFHGVEASSSHVLYLADAQPSNWSRLCLRQADRVILVGDIEAAPPDAWPMPPDPGKIFTPRRDLVLLRQKHQLEPGTTAAWMAGKSEINHHHVRYGEGSDYDRLARLMTEQGIGVVFAGGGARGFAHIGVYRALTEAGLPIDRVGGASMGALIGAGVAAGFDWQQLREMFRTAFVSTNPLSDWTLPFVSLFSGRKVERLLREAYGEVDIEDLARPFFCTAANLTTGHTDVMRSGKLWRRLRASVSLPGILPPMLHGGQVQVDGGVMDNLPVEVMRQEGGGIVVGIDIETAGAIAAGEGVETPWSAWQFLRRMVWRRKETLPLPSIVKILLRSALVNSESATARQREVADLVFRPPASGIDLLDWQSMDRAIEIGYRHALEVIEKERAERPHGVLARDPAARTDL
ncbi:MAG: cyclic nucleotide-binding protein [Alphaproteobacteria bacterium]|nr:cyclic nucleotide-binding protein [Alphaproteobacteria bacterium]